MLYDSLTGLPNAVLFVDRLQQALAHAARRQQQVGLIYLDVDHFRQLISAHGLGCGDAALRELAVRLRHCAERQEDTVARLCGDQFVLVLGDVGGMSGVRNVLNKVTAAVQREFVLDKVAMQITLSMGASVSPRDGKEWSELLRCASISMRRAKSSGGNCYVCYGEDEVVHEGKAAGPLDAVGANLAEPFFATHRQAQLGSSADAPWKNERMLS